MSVTMGPVQLLMIAAIVVGAYYVGTLKAKVDYLQNGGAPTTGTAPAAAAPAVQAAHRAAAAGAVPVAAIAARRAPTQPTNRPQRCS